VEIQARRTYGLGGYDNEPAKAGLISHDRGVWQRQGTGANTADVSLGSSLRHYMRARQFHPRKRTASSPARRSHKRHKLS
jgi:hypothetical protein